mmetsp:Transcript_20488/g.35217  ORF Transcript_20488/g.35217 Transcript_20488/m.35217 type:complete len:364 (-) Transcript_20488:592-1683(-)|eukprot:CAMPEP_0196660060 /NCGR_PEP_ID=MMETSP1086-20130531/37909_1 /TAXON_ID=77921 /ORGANISM="Cyanoptyche  gloeocystis , Strain SAG4.97" /LENGTH=363 /DNA_ID=CAMNT_0041994297 /DNA_START=32 /DNA_END=1123 /DNA_ORIENTATION=+
MRPSGAFPPFQVTLALILVLLLLWQNHTIRTLSAQVGHLDEQLRDVHSNSVAVEEKMANRVLDIHQKMQSTDENMKRAMILLDQHSNDLKQAISKMAQAPPPPPPPEPKQDTELNIAIPPDSPVYDKTAVVDLPHCNLKVSMDAVSMAWYKYYNDRGLYKRTMWAGAQSLQPPLDAWILQEIVFEVKPDLIIEIGTFTGGSAVFFSHMMEIYNTNARILTFDIRDVYQNYLSETRGPCPKCIAANETSLWKRVDFVQGDANTPENRALCRDRASKAKTVLVNIDGQHLYEDIKRDIENFHDFVTPGSYMIVQDTHLTRLYDHKPYAHKACEEFIATHPDWYMDRDREYLVISAHPMGFLKRLK